MTSNSPALRIAWAFGTAALFGLLCWSGAALVLPTAPAAIWPANAVLLAMLMLAPKHDRSLRLSAAWVANVIANLALKENPSVAALLASCNTIELLVACQVMSLLPDVKWSKLESPRTLFAFMLGVGIVPPAVSGLVAAIGDAHLHGTTVLPVFASWLGSHAAGLLVIAPPVLLLMRDGLTPIIEGKRLQLIGSLGLVAGVTLLVFSQNQLPSLFLCLPPLVLAAMVGGFTNASMALLLVAGIATVETLLGHGPSNLLEGAGSTERIAHLQLFLGVAVGMTLPLSAALHERTLLEALLRTQAMVDALTNVASRAKLNEVLPVMWNSTVRRAAPLSIAIIDIDFFKQYNDRYGHLQGDECLKLVAATLAQSFPRGSDLVARFGGEEFVVVMPDTSPEGAALAAARFHTALTQLNLKHEGSQLGRVTVSIGIAGGVATRSDTPSSRLAEADAQLYSAKRTGRARTMVQRPDGQPENVISLGAFRSLQPARVTAG